MKLYLLENCIFYDFGCSGMSSTLTKLTNMFVHDYKLPHHQFFPPPSTYMPIPATVDKMATGLQWTTTEIKPKPTHTQNQSKEFFVTKPQNQ